MRYYAGIGSRKTPSDILKLMTTIAARLMDREFTLRSGHAVGADWAFEQGAEEQSEIFLPWPKFGETPYGKDPGRKVLGRSICDEKLWLNYHEKMVEEGLRDARCPNSHKLLHGRNMAQVLGLPGDPPSEFVVCWTEHGEETEEDCEGHTGGTLTAIRLASRHGIPVFNLQNINAMGRLTKFVKGE